ncbi:META domain-containing protein [Alkalimarinus alittae]|uniref:META domain-containing protein n=1 Tax=Alkalimarinus alittae TaxID=2961619 RepID=A0ABY6MYG5_9ALTE|nr:META domain-containing protein [Alkalimarinus alittae]UZE94887.1 META domain-containing protein [Alkalimarinus alittae]
MKRILIAVALTTLFTACATVDDKSVAVTVKSLQHHNWELTHVDGNTITYPEKTQKPRLEIGENFTANGLAGCNNFFGQAELNESGEFRIDKMAITKKMCSPSEMGIEQVMAETLSSWSQIILTPENLTLKGENHELRLKLRDWM